MMESLGCRLRRGVQVAAEKPECQLTKPLMGWIVVQALRPDQMIVLTGTGKRQRAQ